MIVRGESGQLENCLKSIRPYVAEICIVDTGSTDSSPDIARKYADKFEVYRGCNDDQDRIVDFSNAREKSFSLATQPWVMWIDGDDEVVGAEHLEALCKEYDAARNGQPSMAMFPYEYAHDENGRCILIHYRERLVAPKESFHWVGMVHEVLVPNAGDVRQQTDRIRIIHKRDASRKVIEPGRNLRILKAQYEKFGERDARHLYYLGIEYGNNGDIDNAIKFLTRYIELSGWDDEKYLAALQIADHYINRADYDNALLWSLKSIGIHEKWQGAYFRASKCCYFLAQRGKDAYRNWDRCVNFAQIGLNLPPVNTTLFVNPMEKDFDIHRYLNLALSKTGRTREALESVEKGLQAKPGFPELELNRRIYVEFLAKEDIRTAAKKLVDLGQMGASNRQLLEDILNGVPSIGEKIIQASTPVQESLDTEPKNLSKEELLNHLIVLWKQLLLHDEVLGARSLLKNAPWGIRDHTTVIRMRAITDSMLTHIDDPEAYKTVYRNYKMDREAIPLPEPIKVKDGQFSRFNYLLEKLEMLKAEKSEPLTVLDVGSLDGWVTNRIGLLGYKAFGVDYSENVTNIANSKAVEFETGAQHVCCLFGQDPFPAHFPEKFDVVNIFEVYEHVQDTVALIRTAAERVKPGGILVLSTPRGSWCQGQPVSFHEAWNSPQPREHVRAPILSEVIADMESAGLVDVSGSEFFVDQSEQPVPIFTQASICASGRVPEVGKVLEFKSTKKPKSSKSLDLVFYVGRGVEPWNPITAQNNGIGGSETAVIEMARNLAKLGNRVRVYGDCKLRNNSTSIEGTFEGVEYLDVDRYINLDCDVLITSRRPQAVDNQYNIRRKATLCWVHDVHCGNALTHDRSLKIDKFLVLSDWHRNNVLNVYPFLHPSQMIKTRNGIDLTRFDKKVERNPHRAVFSSSPDRGVQVACSIWPLVRERVPGAELHIYYGFQTWEACADAEQLELIKSLKQLIKDYETAGVTFHGRVSQKMLAEEYLKSGVWAYPTWFAETSCISAMEAHAAGLRMVTSPIAALNETVGDRGTLIPGNWLSWDYQSKFIDAVVQAMQKTDDSDREILKAYARDNFSWFSLATEWNDMFREVIEEVSINIVPKYKGYL